MLFFVICYSNYRFRGLLEGLGTQPERSFGLEFLANLYACAAYISKQAFVMFCAQLCFYWFEGVSLHFMLEYDQS